MTDDIKAPGMMLRLMESRAGVEASQLIMSLPMLRLTAKRGGGETVMVLPGFMTDDNATFLLRRYLSQIGYVVHPWDQGMNDGRMLDYLPPLRERLAALAADGPVRLVGWSRGGIIARELARDDPDLVDRVVTIGSPVKGGMKVSSISNWVRAQTGMTQEQMSQLLKERQQSPISVPVRAIYSRTDGVVAWQACIDDDNPDVEHFEVRGSHSGMGANVEVFRLLPRLLAEDLARQDS